MDLDLLSIFCGPKYHDKCFVASRRWLNRPHSIHRPDYTYASDGVIIIQVPRVQAVPVTDQGQTLHTTFRAKFPPSPIYIPLPHIPDEIAVTCKVCDGRGLISKWWKQRRECEECSDGVNSFEEYCAKIGPAVYDPRYLRLIEELPIPRISIPADEDAPLPFTFMGGIGLLMPMRNNGRPVEDLLTSGSQGHLTRVS